MSCDELVEVLAGPRGAALASACSPSLWGALATLRAALEAPPRDEYHTMKGVYEHRHGLFCALVKTNRSAWKSRKHSDGELCFGGGSFVAGLFFKTTGAPHT